MTTLTISPSMNNLSLEMKNTGTVEPSRSNWGDNTSPVVFFPSLQHRTLEQGYQAEYQLRLPVAEFTVGFVSETEIARVWVEHADIYAVHSCDFVSKDKVYYSIPTEIVNLLRDWHALYSIDEDKFRIRQRLVAMKGLRDGWADGMQSASQWGEGLGKAPLPEGLDWLANQMVTYYSSTLPYPYLYPTTEGGVQIEWSIGSFEASLEVDLSTRVGDWFCTNVDTRDFLEKELTLDVTDGWMWIVSELQRLRAQTA